MSLATHLANFATRVATDVKQLRGWIGNIAQLSTTSSNVVGAVNEVRQLALDAFEEGGAKDLNQLEDVTLTAVANGHILRYDSESGQWLNVLGSTVFDAAGAAAAAQAASQPRNTDLDALSALTTTEYGRAFLELANQAAFMSLIASATETTQGKVELATTAEASAGTDTSRAITAAGLAAHIAAKRGAANGIAGLGSDGKVPAAQLPSFVDDVLEYANQAAFPTSGETGKLYVALDTDRIYRWSGSTYIEISASPGSTDSIAEGLVNKYFTEARALAAVQSHLDGKQPLDATLTALANLTTAANQLVYATGADSFTTTSLTAFARTLLDDANAAAARTTLEVYSKTEIGNPEQDLVAIYEAGLAA